MARYRSKPVVIEAVQLLRGMEGTPWLADEITAQRYWYSLDGDGNLRVRLTTANGVVWAEEGDWIIREPSGIGCYPCKPDVFAAKYEPFEAA